MQLCDPIEIRDRRFANRAVLAPMVPNLAAEDGVVTPAYRDFYLARARAQVGYLLLGGTYVHPDGKGFNHQLGICDDAQLPGLQALVAAVSPYGRIGVQLSFKSVGRLPEVFSRKEIGTYREAFARAARRARAAGFDAVELHACHDYWLNYFLSPHFNHRSDAYGGTLQNRFRLLKETVAAVGEAVGGDLLLGVRLSMDEFVDDGLTLDETVQVGRWLQALGVDYLSASGGIGLTQYRMSPPMEVERGSLLPLARALKQQVRVPVIGVGRLDRPALLRGAVADGDADMAAVARSLIADPEYVAKVLAGRDADIRPCVACNFCLLRLHRGEALRCAVNPQVGSDLARPPKLTRDVYTVVVGGGPAGLSYAATAAARGARVRLYERHPHLGGMVTIGGRPPFKAGLQDLVDYLARAVTHGGVEVLTGCEASAARLRGEKAVRIVIATGAVPQVPPVEGELDPGVCTTAVKILAAPGVPPGDYLVVGGGAVGLETAEYLVHAGAAVTVLEMTDVIGSGLHATRLTLLKERLHRAGVEILKNTCLKSVAGRAVRVDCAGQEMRLGPFERVVFAVGAKSDRHLADDLPGDLPIEIIGDARQPLSIYEAVRDGYEAALRLV